MVVQATTGVAQHAEFAARPDEPEATSPAANCALLAPHAAFEPPSRLKVRACAGRRVRGATHAVGLARPSAGGKQTPPKEVSRRRTQLCRGWAHSFAQVVEGLVRVVQEKRLLERDSRDSTSY